MGRLLMKGSVFLLAVAIFALGCERDSEGGATPPVDVVGAADSAGVDVATGTDTPATGSDTPATGADTPATGSDTPSTGSDTPSTGGDTAGPTGCSGVCDPTADEELTCLTDGMTLCYCDSAASEWATYTCAAYCADGGGTGDQCSDAGGDYCACTYDCTDTAAVQAACEAGAFTPCTCAAADPCAWVGDGYCDVESCNEYYPDQQNFDDTAEDCGSNADQDCTDTAAVQASCEALEYTNCTCAAADPCTWVGDGYCDKVACDESFPEQQNFDDTAADCGSEG